MSISTQLSNTKYIENTSFEERKRKFNSLLTKFPDKIPVILEKSKTDNYLPKMDKTKLLLSHDMTIATILQLLKKNIDINENTAIYIMVSNKNIMLSGTLTISSIYKEHKHDDGFLYLEYCTENVFG